MTNINIRDFLITLEGFNLLPSDVLDDLSNKFTLYRYQMGQKILSADRKPNKISIIYEGQARLLHSEDKKDKKFKTLSLLEKSAIVGWISLLRGVSCETAIASIESVVLTLPSDDFFELLDEHEEFKRYFYYSNNYSEIADLLSNYYQDKGVNPLNFKELVLNSIFDAKVEYLAEGAHATRELAENLSWFVSSEPGLYEFGVGSCLDIIDPDVVFKVNSGQSIRLLGLPSDIINSVTDSSDLQTGNNAIDFETIPYASEEEEESDSEEVVPSDFKPVGNYPYASANNAMESVIACCQMLSQYYNFPFRKQMIRRILKERVPHNTFPNLGLCGAIMEAIGLNAQSLSIPTHYLTRVQAPALIRWKNKLAILYEVDLKSIVIAIPGTGIKRCRPEEIIEALDDKDDKIDIILLASNELTPKQKFGFKWFLPYIWKYKGILMEVFIVSFFVQLFALANPLILQVIIDKVIVQNSIDTLHVLGIFLLAVAIFEAILGGLRTYLFVDTTNRIDVSLGSHIIDHLYRLPLKYYDKRPVGELSNRFHELESIRSFLTGTALTVVLDAVFSVVYISVMFYYSATLSLVALSTIPLFIILTILYNPVIQDQIREYRERNAATEAYLVETITGVQTVKAQNIELRTRWTWQSLYSKSVSSQFKTVITSTFADSISKFLNQLSGLIVLWYGAYMVLKGELTLGGLIAFRIIANYVTTPLLRLTQIWQKFQEMKLSLERLSDIVDTPQEGEENRENLDIPPIKGLVEYRNISFRFKPSTPLQLVDVNLKVLPGTFVGVVGRSGAGKSTLVKLLSRLYEPEGGQILVDGYDIGKVELYSLRRQLGIVPQDPLLFQGTVQENILLTNPDASSEEMETAAKIAAAHDFIMELPRGYQTNVGERGSALSGGQRQRIAIARTILARPKLLILDEATSAVDYVTEQQLSRNLAEVFREHTVFFITHRLNTIKNADLIVVMDQGKIVEQGKHDELMNQKGYYYSLARQQVGET